VSLTTIIVSAKVKRAVQRLASLILLFVYITAISNVARLHAHEHEIAHMDRQEQDPCHRAMYHQDLQNGCDHDSHLVASSDDCDLCHHLTFHKDQHDVVAIDYVSANFATINVNFNLADIEPANTLVRSSRAPPAFFI
jgi:hypothetical protein